MAEENLDESEVGEKLSFPGAKSKYEVSQEIASKLDPEVEADKMIEDDEAQQSLITKVTDILTPVYEGLRDTAGHADYRKRRLILPGQPLGRYVATWQDELQVETPKSPIPINFSSELFFDKEPLLGSIPNLQFYALTIQGPEYTDISSLGHVREKKPTARLAFNIASNQISDLELSWEEQGWPVNWPTVLNLILDARGRNKPSTNSELSRFVSEVYPINYTKKGVLGINLSEPLSLSLKWDASGFLDEAGGKHQLTYSKSARMFKDPKGNLHRSMAPEEFLKLTEDIRNLLPMSSKIKKR